MPEELVRFALNEFLADQIVSVAESLARNAMIEDCQYNFLGNGTKITGAVDFSNILASEAFGLDLKFLDDLAYRLRTRSAGKMQKYGTYANPLPGGRDGILVVASSGVVRDLWNKPESELFIDLRILQDQRIINGGSLQWKGITVSDYSNGPILWNAGNIDAQAMVTQPIHFGDGAPDPDTGTPVNNIWYTGQNSAGIVHYIQLDVNTPALVMAEFQDCLDKGDFVTLHSQRTATWGITGVSPHVADPCVNWIGVNFLDGETQNLELISVDAINKRLAFVLPMTYEYEAKDANGAYAYVTKATHIHPVICFGKRGSHVLAQREKVQYYTPTDDYADIPSIKRVTWDWDGVEMNPWDTTLYEIAFCAASYANTDQPEIR